MKIKTSVSISENALAAIKKIAAREDRSVSYVLEKFIEQKVQELSKNQPAVRKTARRQIMPVGIK
jgi:predicted CopG family antitoxin